MSLSVVINNNARRGVSSTNAHRLESAMVGRVNPHADDAELRRRSDRTLATKAGERTTGAILDVYVVVVCLHAQAAEKRPGQGPIVAGRVGT